MINKQGHIVSTRVVRSKELDEIEEVLGFRPSVEQTKENIKTKFNPYFNQVWGDFNWLRSLFGNTNVRCYATTISKLKQAGITSHIGMYDLIDNDGVLDFYVGVDQKLDSRAKKNGFQTNFAWIFCHEWSHGKEQLHGSPDRVHQMEKDGRLKELIAEQRRKTEKMTLIKQLATEALSLLRKFKWA